MSIRTDHDQEFDNEVQFGAFCDANGITHNFSTPHTPQSNGIVERKNRTLREMSHTMLNEQSIPQKFWCNAVDTSTYILNRILIRTFLRKTPYELFIEPVELIFSTPPTSPHPFFDSLEYLPPRTTNLPPPQPSFDSIERLANQPPPVPDVMEPPFPPLPPQLPPHSQPMSLNNAFPPLSHEMFCENYQRAQGSLFGIRFAAMAGIPSEILHAQVDALCVIAVI
ncbi:retrovirus-related pol polyprotein from transposon TNT 1-94 [Tanacetum coccineum]